MSSITRVRTTIGTVRFVTKKNETVQARCRGQQTICVVASGNKFTATCGEYTTNARTPQDAYRKAVKANWSV